MKCIHCGSDTKYKDRQANGGKCGSCGHSFAFEPKVLATYGVSDGLFERVIKDVSGEGQVWFTEKQLWYEFNRRILRKKFWKGRWGMATGLSGVGGIAVAVAAASFWPVLIGACGVTYGIVMNNRARKRDPQTPIIPREKFQENYLRRWVEAHGSIARMLQPPSRKASAAPPSAELASYSFDRALVTDSADAARLLVANNFHFENNCAILSVNGYPSGGLSETLMGMLRRNPSLKVFALHDASMEGCLLPRLLRGPDWFPDLAVPVIDLGLRPAHILKTRLIQMTGPARALPEQLAGTLAPEEAKWLEAGNMAELEALRPERLMRAVFQGFARANQMGDDVMVDDGPTIWIYDSGMDVYATDSFG